MLFHTEKLNGRLDLLNVETLLALLFASAKVCDLVTLLVDDGVSIEIAKNQEKQKRLNFLCGLQRLLILLMMNEFENIFDNNK